MTASDAAVSWTRLPRTCRGTCASSPSTDSSAGHQRSWASPPVEGGGRVAVLERRRRGRGLGVGFARCRARAGGAEAARRAGERRPGVSCVARGDAGPPVPAVADAGRGARDRGADPPAVPDQGRGAPGPSEPARGRPGDGADGVGRPQRAGRRHRSEPWRRSPHEEPRREGRLRAARLPAAVRRPARQHDGRLADADRARDLGQGPHRQQRSRRPDLLLPGDAGPARAAVRHVRRPVQAPNPAVLGQSRLRAGRRAAASWCTTADDVWIIYAGRVPLRHLVHRAARRH